jgi:hypothetical protein
MKNCSIFRICDPHMPDGERRKPIDIEVCRIKVKVTTSKNRTKIIHFSFVSARYLKNEMSANLCSIFRSCDLDLCPTNFNIDRLPTLTIRHVCTKFYLDLTFRS